RQVGEQQVMIDDDDVRIERLAPGVRDMTTGELRTARAETVVARRGDLRPHRMGVRESGDLREIAAARGPRPTPDALEHAFASLARGVQAMAAEIIAAPLQQGDLRRPSEGRADERQVL